MEIKKKKGLTKLNNINIVDPEKNTARTMAACRCSCNCTGPDSYHTQNNTFSAIHSNIMYALGG
jgi:hypothetical protein